MSEQANFSELRSKLSDWNLEAEEMLLNKMQIFTNSYKSDFAAFTANMENLSNHLTNAQVENYNAISSLQDLSMNRFIEEKLEEKSESVSEESDRGFESQKEVFLDNNEKIKKAAEISTINIDAIYAKKEKNKEKIEDDTVSVASKNLVLDNSKKYNFPFIIGTDDFLKNKNIGLVNEIEENEEEKNKDKQEDSDEEDPDVKEYVKDIAVDEKTKKKWEKVHKRKTIKKKKQKAKLEKQKSKKKKEDDNNSNKEDNKDDFDEEVKDEIKVPIEIENSKEDKNDDNLVVSSGKGSSVPPPPPPPPKPILDPAKVQSKPKNNVNMNVNNNNNKIIEPIQKPKIVQSVNPLLLAGLHNIGGEDDDDDEDDGGLFSKNNIMIKPPTFNNNNFNFAQSQNPVISPNNFNNLQNNNNNTNINKAKLNDIFEEDKDEDNEEKKNEEKLNNENNAESNKVNNQEKQDEGQNEIKNIIPLKQTKISNSLFDFNEEEKNNAETVEIKKPQANIESKKKLNLFFADDDE